MMTAALAAQVDVRAVVVRGVRGGGGVRSRGAHRRAGGGVRSGGRVHANPAHSVTMRVLRLDGGAGTTAACRSDGEDSRARRARDADDNDDEEEDEDEEDGWWRRGRLTQAAGGARLTAAAVSAAMAAMVATPGTAAAGSYGAGLGYFEALERERAISEEPVPLAARDGRRANAPSLERRSAEQMEKAPPRGIPMSLSADGTEDDTLLYPSLYADENLNRRGENRTGAADYARWGRAVFQWSVIVAAAAGVRRARTRGSAVTKRLGLAGVAGVALVNTRWRLTLDIGREPGTWMPPGWGASGRRILLPIAVRLGEGGAVEPLAVGAFLPMTMTAGSWRLEGDALTFDIQMSGMTRGDIVLPEGRLHFRTAAWGATMASKGRLLLLQTRFGVRREWRMVGVFKSEPLGDGDDDGGGGGGGGGDDLYEENRKKLISVPPMRVTERRTE